MVSGVVLMLFDPGFLHSVILNLLLQSTRSLRLNTEIGKVLLHQLKAVCSYFADHSVIEAAHDVRS